MFRDSGGPRRESAALLVTRAAARSLIAAIAVAALICICGADLNMGPTLSPGQTLHGRFVQERHLQGLASTLKSSGTFVLAPGKGLIWRIEDPIRTTTVITPAGIRQIINGSEVQRIDAARLPFIAHFYDMLNGALMGDWAAMRHDFAVKTTGDRNAWRTVLTPLRPDDPIAGMLTSIVVSGGKVVEDVDINRTNGDSEHMAFLDQTVSSAALSGYDARLLDQGPSVN
jgi:Outer membrane lipoprotein carrier protein LolA-like